MKNPFDINKDGKLDLGEFALAAGVLDEISRWKAKDDYEECSDYSGTDRSSDFDDDEMEFDDMDFDADF